MSTWPENIKVSIKFR